MKRTFLVILIFNFIMAATFIMPIKQAEASLITASYKLAKGTTEAVVKSLEARKGFKTIGGTTNANSITQAISKGMQDVAADSWDTINGKKFNSTPLKNMPGWLKVVMGTGSFLSGADAVFDIYDAIIGGSMTEIQTLAPYSEVNRYFYSTTSLAGWSVTAKWDGSHTTFDVHFPDGKTYTTPFSADMNWYPKQVYIQLDPENSNKANIFAEHPTKTTEYARLNSDRKPNLYDYANTAFDPYPKNMFGVFMTVYNVSKFYNFEATGPTQPIPDDQGLVMTIPAPTVERYVTPEIDTSKDVQVLIVPDPDFHVNLDLAIENNREMVSDPEKYLAENPQDDDGGVIVVPDEDEATGVIGKMAAYVVDMYTGVVNFMKNSVEMMGELTAGTAGMVVFLTSFFAWLPRDYVTLLSVALMMGVVAFFLRR